MLKLIHTASCLRTSISAIDRRMVFLNSSSFGSFGSRPNSSSSRCNVDRSSSIRIGEGVGKDCGTRETSE